MSLFPGTLQAAQIDLALLLLTLPLFLTWLAVWLITTSTNQRSKQ